MYNMKKEKVVKAIGIGVSLLDLGIDEYKY
jgi:hypothetical protein